MDARSPRSQRRRSSISPSWRTLAAASMYPSLLDDTSSLEVPDLGVAVKVPSPFDKLLYFSPLDSRSSALHLNEEYPALLCGKEVDGTVGGGTSGDVPPLVSKHYHRPVLPGASSLVPAHDQLDVPPLARPLGVLMDKLSPLPPTRDTRKIEERIEIAPIRDGRSSSSPRIRIEMPIAVTISSISSIDDTVAVRYLKPL